MASDDGPSFGGLSLGGISQTDQPASTFGSGSIFGHAAPVSPTQNSGDSKQPSIESVSVIKPATGFGAFAILNSQPGGFGNMASKDTPTAIEAPKPLSAFGKSGFEAKASGQSIFGQSGFGGPQQFCVRKIHFRYH